MLVLGVIAERTVSLVWLSQHADTDAKPESLYRRFQRFFALCVLPPKRVGALVLALAPKPPGGWVLAMDRTNWQAGETHVNILVVSVIVDGVGFPIAWRVLPKSTKRGNSRKHHRIALMEDVLSILPATEIRALTMDREFVGHSWLAWLRLVDVPYVVRIKSNTRIGAKTAGWLCRWGRWKKQAGQCHEVFGEQVFFAAARIKKGRDEYVAVISNGFSGGEALALYRQRWGIETLFGHLKKRGYQFEDTHLTKKDRIEKLTGVLAVAFALCHRWGQRIEDKTGRRVKKHGYRAKSVFRMGFESLHRMLSKPWRFARDIAQFFEVVIRRPLLEKIVV